MDYSEYTVPSTTVKEYRFTTSDGVALNVIDFTPAKKTQGKPVILFVAGWISLISGWKGALRELTPEFRTIYIETREKHSSILPPDRTVSFTMERLTLDIGEAVEALIPKKQKFVLAGSSLGASAIIEYCALDARHPDCAILIGPNAEFRFPKFLGDIIPSLSPKLYFAAKPVIKWYLRNFRIQKGEEEQMKKYENTLDTADPYKLKANALAIKNYAIWDKLARVTTPCVIFGATSDTLHGTENLEKLRALMPKTDYIELASNKETHSEKAGRIIVEYLAKKKYAKL